MGTVERWQDRESGNFYCPACGSERVFRHRRSRNWLKVVVPLLPRDVTADVYECQGCHRAFDEHVITSPPASALSTRIQHVTRAATVLAILDGDPYDEASRRVAVGVIQGAGLPHYSSADLDADLRSIDVSQFEAEAAQLTVDMDTAARERLVIDIGHVATAAGSFSPANRSMVDRLGRVLELTPGAVHKILGRLDQEAANIGAFAVPQPGSAEGNVPGPG